MDIRKLQRVIVDALDDVKAHDIRVFNTSEQTGLFDRVIIATGTSNRQTRALASHVREKAKAAGGHVISTEGEETGEWVLVDLGDAVVHIMQPAIRVYYNLEELWGSKPVQIKRSAPAGSSRTPRKAVTDAIEQAPAEPRARGRLKEPEESDETVAKPKAPSRARKQTPSEGAAETLSRETGKAPRKRSVKASPEGPAGEPREAPALAPDDPQSGAATPKRRAARKAGLG